MINNKIYTLYKFSQAIYAYPLSDDDQKKFNNHLMEAISSPSHVASATFAQKKFVEYIYNFVVLNKKREKIEQSKPRISDSKYFSSRYRAIYEAVNKQSSFGPSIICLNFTGWLNRTYFDKFSEIINDAIGN